MSKFCFKCGVQLKDSAKFCNKCGEPVKAQTLPTAQKVIDMYERNLERLENMPPIEFQPPKP